VPSYEEQRYELLMNAGNNFRATLARCDALALLAARQIRELRSSRTGDPTKPPDHRTAYIIRRLVRKEEVKTLRTIYGRGFFLIAAYSSRPQRGDVLSKKIAESHNDADKEKYRSEAEYIIQRDAGEIVPKDRQGDEQLEFGQDVRRTFPMADIFLSSENRGELKNNISRFVKLIYSFPYSTPKQDEAAMFHAYAAALRSGDLSRQVGAVITTPEGGIVAAGCNDVPKAGGGLFWADDSHDDRDHTWGYEAGSKARIDILGEVVKELREHGWLASSKRKRKIETLVKDELIGGKLPILRESQLMDLLEFGRSVHAEMAALMDAACRGVAVKGCTLYSTTFPCHICARHIIAAGIDRVVYIEPYPKSRAEDLYPKSVTVNAEGVLPDRVRFEAFAGIAPRSFMTLFEAPKRKDDEGKILHWEPLDENARVGRFVASYLQMETKAVEWLLSALARKRIKFVK